MMIGMKIMKNLLGMIKVIDREEKKRRKDIRTKK